MLCYKMVHLSTGLLYLLSTNVFYTNVMYVWVCVRPCSSFQTFLSVMKSSHLIDLCLSEQDNKWILRKYEKQLRTVTTNLCNINLTSIQRLPKILFTSFYLTNLECEAGNLFSKYEYIFNIVFTIYLINRIICIRRIFCTHFVDNTF